MGAIAAIDLSLFLEGTAAEQRAIASDVDAICSSIGFLIIEGHGVKQAVVDAAWSACRAFFDLPQVQKIKARSPDPGCPRGYFPFEAEALAQSLGVETPPDIKESFGVGPLRVPSRPISAEAREFHYGPNIWPSQPAGLREALMRYFEELEALGSRVLRLFAAALELPQDYFEQFHTDPMCALRCINYPAIDSEPLPNQRGAGEHADYGSITILKSDPTVPGLEIRLPNGDWIAAPLVSDAFIVNIGDMMARWTNDRWVSTLHRVSNPRNEAGGTDRRQSMAFFHNASFDAEIDCIPTCRAADVGSRYSSVLAGEYLVQRFSAALAG